MVELPVDRLGRCTDSGEYRVGATGPRATVTFSAIVHTFTVASCQRVIRAAQLPAGDDAAPFFSPGPEGGRKPHAGVSLQNTRLPSFGFCRPPSRSGQSPL